MLSIFIGLFTGTRWVPTLSYHKYGYTGIPMHAEFFLVVGRTVITIAQKLKHG